MLFSTGLAAALRVTDGALVVVHCVCVHVLHHTTAELIKPVYVRNKMNRTLLELQLHQDALHQTFQLVSAENINVFAAAYYLNDNGLMEPISMNSSRGSVSFDSVVFPGWDFTLQLLNQ